ncbi:MAG: bifunctional folylpolyglutamate synthase/dihydrofolate synthase [Clostridia bacterium]|nr:bifunctional folylpolyglutamate synthase/dihydrofolate synthase [Clostridia bacterium]
MNYKETLNYIHSCGRFSHKASLERITAVCEKLGNPQNNFKCIHIAGTNGKGSTCAFITSALIAAGYRVGAFISPFITDFCERIQINGKNISHDDLCRLSQRVIDTGVALTEFEFITAVGFLYFSENKIQVAVLETGLGGRFDATNVIPKPLLSVITKIGLDHTAVLGDTISQIATEKCGIIKGDNVVTSHNQPSDALSVIKNHATNAITPEATDLKAVKCSILGNNFIYKDVCYETSLGGEYQIENALIAIETLKNCKLPISETDMQTGLKNAFIPARLEVVSRDPLIVIDGAHNPDGAGALTTALKEYNGTTAIIGVMRDKNYGEVLAKTLPFCKNIICVRPEGPRSLPAEELANEAQKYCNSIFTANTLGDAVTLAKEKAKGKPIFIFGSLYLASQIRPLLK